MKRNNTKTTPPHLKGQKHKAFEMARIGLSSAQMIRLNRLEDSNNLTKVWIILFEKNALKSHTADNQKSRIRIVAEILKTAVQSPDIYKNKSTHLSFSDRKRKIEKTIASIKRLQNSLREFKGDSPLKMWPIFGLARLNLNLSNTFDIGNNIGKIIDRILSSSIAHLESEISIEIQDPNMPSHKTSIEKATKIYVQNNIARLLLEYYEDASPTAIASLSDVLTGSGSTKANTVIKLIKGLPKSKDVFGFIKEHHKTKRSEQFVFISEKKLT